MSVPQDIKPCWFNPIRRLQSVAAKNNGMAIITIKFVINEEGEPVQWSDPKLTMLEPKRDTNTLLDLLTE